MSQKRKFEFKYWRALWYLPGIVLAIWHFRCEVRGSGTPEVIGAVRLTATAGTLLTFAGDHRDDPLPDYGMWQGLQDVTVTSRTLRGVFLQIEDSSWRHGAQGTRHDASDLFDSQMMRIEGSFHSIAILRPPTYQKVGSCDGYVTVVALENGNSLELGYIYSRERLYQYFYEFRPHEMLTPQELPEAEAFDEMRASIRYSDRTFAPLPQAIESGQ